MKDKWFAITLKGDDLMDRDRLELHNINFDEFLQVVDSCSGNVFMETDDGDCLNLKSKLCKLIGLTKLIKGGYIKEITIKCELPEDETKLFRFNLFKEVK